MQESGQVTGLPIKEMSYNLFADCWPPCGGRILENTNVVKGDFMLDVGKNATVSNLLHDDIDRVTYSFECPTIY